MKLLITGIHGFVGSNLVAALGGDHTIYGLDIIAPTKEGVEATYSWDDLKAGKVPPVDAIIHLAGKAHDTKNKAQDAVYFAVNTGLTQTIFDYFSQSNAQKFFFFSSVKAAAESVCQPPLTESVVPTPNGPYGESKIKAEEYILAKMKEHPILFDPKEVFILRPCMIHGPGNKGNLNLLYQVVKKGIPWPLGAYENKRSFTSIDNLVYLIQEMLIQSIPSGIYHVADDETISTNKLIEIICSVTGKRVRIWKLPIGFMQTVAKCGALFHLPLNPERLRKLTESYEVSNQKLKQALQIDKLPVRAADGLQHTISYFEKK